MFKELVWIAGDYVVVVWNYNPWKEYILMEGIYIYILMAGACDVGRSLFYCWIFFLVELCVFVCRSVCSKL